MSNYIVMIHTATSGASLRSQTYATVEAALQRAKVLISDGAALAWIVNSDGSIFLPADQVRCRLGAMGEQNRALIEAPTIQGHRFDPILPS